MILQPSNGRPLVTGLNEVSRDRRIAPIAADLVEAGSRGAASPALNASAGLDVPAYEWEFLLTEAQAVEVERRARLEMVPGACD